jgi:hypothetical protein
VAEPPALSHSQEEGVVARNIDWEKPLSAEDKAYALQRDMHDKVAENEAKYGRADMPAGAERDQRIEELGRQITERQNELDMLLHKKAEDEGLGGPAVRGGETVTSGTFTEGDKSQTGQDPVRHYDGPEWTLAKLQAEIAKRNEERAAEEIPELSARGTKAELVERLMQDDKEIAEANAADAG